MEEYVHSTGKKNNDSDNKDKSKAEFYSNIFDKFFNQSSIKEKVEKLYEIDKEIIVPLLGPVKKLIDRVNKLDVKKIWSIRS